MRKKRCEFYVYNKQVWQRQQTQIKWKQQIQRNRLRITVLFQLNVELFTAKWLMQNNGILWLFVIWLGYVNLLHWNSWGFHVLPNNCNQICWMYTHKHTFHPPKRHYWCVHCAWSMSMEMIFKQHKYIWNVWHTKRVPQIWNNEISTYSWYAWYRVAWQWS